MKSSEAHFQSNKNGSASRNFFSDPNTANAFFQSNPSPQARSFFNPEPFFQSSKAGQPGAPVQAKLTVGSAGDNYEREADQVASQVVTRINDAPSQTSGEPQSVQRMGEEDENLQMAPVPETIQRMGMEKDNELQSMPAVQCVGNDGGAVSTDFEAEVQKSKGSGQALAPDLQAQMGQAMGADFSGVRVHTDARSDRLNQSIQAKAFTTGPDVFFRQGAYEPGSRGGQELIAHELTHVVQQKQGLVKPSMQAKEVFSQNNVESDSRRNSLTDLQHDTYPSIDHEDSPRSKTTNPGSQSAVVQRAWDTHLLNYSDIKDEKTQEQIRTGKVTLFTKSIQDWIKKFHDGLQQKKEEDIKAALQGLLKRLTQDQTAAAAGKLKAPKEVDNFDKTAAMAAAATFFAKWIQSVNEHLNHIEQGGDWVYDFRQKYIHDVEAAKLTPKEQILKNVANIPRVDEEDIKAVGIMWDRGDGPQQQRMITIMGGITEMRRMSSMEYFLEQVSPVHIGYTKVLDMFNHWKQGVLYHSFFNEAWQTWMAKPNSLNVLSSSETTIVDSYDAGKRAEYRLIPQGKAIMKADSTTPLVGDNIYVLAKDIEWYGGAKEGPVHHSSFMQGAPVKCAGHLHTDPSGNLKIIDISSGHYAPTEADLKRAMAVLSKQMDISDVKTGGFQ